MDLYFICKCIIGVDSECRKLLELVERKDSDLCLSVREAFESINWGEGWCANYDRVVRETDPECSVGLIRKDRDRVVNEDNTCYSCPLFIPYYVLSVINDVCSGRGTVDDVRVALKKRFLELFLPESLGGGRVD